MKVSTEFSVNIRSRTEHGTLYDTVAMLFSRTGKSCTSVQLLCKSGVCLLLMKEYPVYKKILHRV